jgi:hypothetical protein
LAEQGIDFSAALADCVYVLKKGTIRYTGPAEEVVATLTSEIELIRKPSDGQLLPLIGLVLNWIEKARRPNTRLHGDRGPQPLIFTVISRQPRCCCRTAKYLVR